MALFGLLGIARDGISAQGAALTTTGSNISNVATPGYVRRTVLFETANNGGVRYTRTERSFDRFAYGHVVDEQAKYGAAEARSGALAEVESVVTPQTGAFGDEAISLVKAFNSLAGFPIDPSLRFDVIAKADNLASSLKGTRAALETKSANILGQTNDLVADLNVQMKRIADLNQQIATAVGSGGDASALRDQRDSVIRTVGERIGGRAIEDSTGRVTLFAAGTVLVEGNNAATLSVDLDNTTGKMRFFSNAATKTEITSRIDTGTLGGLREARDVDITKIRQSLDSYAYDVANAFNAVHERGFGMDGQDGRPLFNVPTGVDGAAATLSVNPDLVDHPERVGASVSAGDLPGGNDIALELANLADTQSFGGQTLADRYAAIATDLGFRRNTAEAESNLRTDTLAVAESLADSANGISIDEEMVNLTQFQRAFEANTKVLKTADELLQSLMNSF